LDKESSKKKKILVCKYCGKRAEKLILEAMLVELGCSVSPSPSWCPESPTHEHELVEIDE